MGNSQETMPKVNFKENEQLKIAHSYSKYLEEKNLERYIFAKKSLRKKRILCAASFATVISIYAYTILRVKQETFLDDFEEPPRIIRNE